MQVLIISKFLQVMFGVVELINSISGCAHTFLVDLHIKTGGELSLLDLTLHQVSNVFKIVSGSFFSLRLLRQLLINVLQEFVLVKQGCLSSILLR